MSRPGNSDDLLSRWAKRREAVAQEEANTEAAELVEETELAPEPETEEEAMARRFVGSPTIRVDGEDVDPQGIAGAQPAMGCRIYRRDDGRISPLPSEEMIRRALQKRT